MTQEHPPFGLLYCRNFYIYERASKSFQTTTQPFSVIVGTKSEEMDENKLGEESIALIREKGDLLISPLHQRTPFPQ